MSLIEAIGSLGELSDLSQYTYYSLAGPYLEDCRLLYEFYPKISMVSIEEDEDTLKRQEFHLPCRNLELKSGILKSFLAQYDPKDRKSIFWLDYVGLELGHFEDFEVLLGKVPTNSLIKITLKAEPLDYKDKPEEFRNKFESLLPSPSLTPPIIKAEFAYLIQQMLQIASQQALPSAIPHAFQPVSSFYYSDGTPMFSLIGIVCARNELGTVRNVFKKLQFANLDWSRPKSIDLPKLSTKERLHIQSLLPCAHRPGRTLRTALGYLIDADVERTERKLDQYAEFHRHFPYLMKATP